MKYVLVRQQYERIHLCESMLALLRRMAKYFSLSDLIKLVVARKIFEKKKISNFKFYKKSVPLGAVLFHADGWT